MYEVWTIINIYNKKSNYNTNVIRTVQLKKDYFVISTLIKYIDSVSLIGKYQLLSLISEIEVLIIEIGFKNN